MSMSVQGNAAALLESQQDELEKQQDQIEVLTAERKDLAAHKIVLSALNKALEAENTDLINQKKAHMTAMEKAERTIHELQQSNAQSMAKFTGTIMDFFIDQLGAISSRDDGNAKASSKLLLERLKKVKTSSGALDQVQFSALVPRGTELEASGTPHEAHHPPLDSLRDAYKFMEMIMATSKADVAGCQAYWKEWQAHQEEILRAHACAMRDMAARVVTMPVTPEEVATALHEVASDLERVADVLAGNTDRTPSEMLGLIRRVAKAHDAAAAAADAGRRDIAGLDA
ncbi:hypothetical protein GQ53DRAFT_868831 [Thozetella sp. PMI_491]|nr:hypothetical protein GQ53DRAFT_868831 [Thozetella sp. PMI_491]